MFLLLIHIITYAIDELSSPPLLNDVRRIAYECVQAIEEAQEIKRASINTKD